MNNKLPECFSFTQSVLPTVAAALWNMKFFVSHACHKARFAECSLQYCLINQLNSEKCLALLTDKVRINSFHSYKVFTKIASSILCNSPVIILITEFI